MESTPWRSGWTSAKHPTEARSNHAAALRQADYQHDQGKHQQQMNGAAEGIAADHPQRPHQEKNEENSEHRNSFLTQFRRKGSCWSWFEDTLGSKADHFRIVFAELVPRLTPVAPWACPNVPWSRA